MIDVLSAVREAKGKLHKLVTNNFGLDDSQIDWLVRQCFDVVCPIAAAISRDVRIENEELRKILKEKEKGIDIDEELNNRAKLAEKIEKLQKRVEWFEKITHGQCFLCEDTENCPEEVLDKCLNTGSHFRLIEEGGK